MKGGGAREVKQAARLAESSDLPPVWLTERQAKPMLLMYEKLIGLRAEIVQPKRCEVCIVWSPEATPWNGPHPSSVRAPPAATDHPRLKAGGAAGRDPHRWAWCLLAGVVESGLPQLPGDGRPVAWRRGRCRPAARGRAQLEGYVTTSIAALRAIMLGLPLLVTIVQKQNEVI